MNMMERLDAERRAKSEREHLKKMSVAFLDKYYHYLCTDPKKLAGIFTPASNFCTALASYCTPTGSPAASLASEVLPITKGRESIAVQLGILSPFLLGSVFDFAASSNGTVDAQYVPLPPASASYAVDNDTTMLIVVTGRYTPPRDIIATGPKTIPPVPTSRSYAHTIILERAEGSSQYKVVNDVFRFVYQQQQTTDMSLVLDDGLPASFGTLDELFPSFANSLEASNLLVSPPLPPLPNAPYGRVAAPDNAHSSQGGGIGIGVGGGGGGAASLGGTQLWGVGLKNEPPTGAQPGGRMGDATSFFQPPGAAKQYGDVDGSELFPPLGGGGGAAAFRETIPNPPTSTAIKGQPVGKRLLSKDPQTGPAQHALSLSSYPPLTSAAYQTAPDAAAPQTYKQTSPNPPFLCVLCSIQCKNTADFVAHRKTEGHINNSQSYNKRPLNTNMKLQPTAQHGASGSGGSSPYPNACDVGRSPFDPLLCTVCEKPMLSPCQLTEHLVGKKHREQCRLRGIKVANVKVELEAAATAKDEKPPAPRPAPEPAPAAKAVAGQKVLKQRDGTKPKPAAATAPPEKIAVAAATSTPTESAAAPDASSAALVAEIDKPAAMSQMSATPVAAAVSGDDLLPSEYSLVKTLKDASLSALAAGASAGALNAISDALAIYGDRPGSSRPVNQKEDKCLLLLRRSEIYLVERNWRLAEDDAATVVYDLYDPSAETRGNLLFAKFCLAKALIEIGGSSVSAATHDGASALEDFVIHDQNELASLQAACELLESVVKASKVVAAFKGPPSPFHLSGDELVSAEALLKQTAEKVAIAEVFYLATRKELHPKDGGTLAGHLSPDKCHDLSSEEFASASSHKQVGDELFSASSFAEANAVYTSALSIFGPRRGRLGFQRFLKLQTLLASCDALMSLSPPNATEALLQTKEALKLDPKSPFSNLKYAKTLAALDASVFKDEVTNGIKMLETLSKRGDASSLLTRTLRNDALKSLRSARAPLMAAVKKILKLELPRKNFGNAEALLDSIIACELNKCSLCSLVPREPLITKCGHFACKDCWGKLQFLKPNCPICNTKIGAVASLEGFLSCYEEGCKRLRLLFDVVVEYRMWGEVKKLVPDKFLSVMSLPEPKEDESKLVTENANATPSDALQISGAIEAAAAAKDVVDMIVERSTADDAAAPVSVEVTTTTSGSLGGGGGGGTEVTVDDDVLSPADYDRVCSLKLAGNNFFTTNNFLEAADKYNQALAVYGASRRGGAAGNIQWEERLKILGNLAEAQLRLERWVEARGVADLVLEADSTNLKGIFRRAKALKGEGTIETLQEALPLFVKLTNMSGGFQTAQERQVAETFVRDVRTEIKAKKAGQEVRSVAMQSAPELLPAENEDGIEGAEDIAGGEEDVSDLDDMPPLVVDDS